MEKTIYPYIRFSREEQKKGASLKRQEARIKKYANENGFKVSEELELKDLGKSAFTGKNVTDGSLGRFLEAIKLGQIPKDGSSYLCIEQIDRLSRQDIDSASSLFKSILRENVNIITLMDNKIYTKKSLNSFMDIMYSLFLMEQAYIESLKKSERIQDVFDQKKEKLLNGENIQFVGMFPGWIDNTGTKQNTNFIFNEKVEVVREVFELYGNQGKSLRDITNYLDSNNIPQIARKRHKNFTNRWSSGKVSHLLSNRAAIGELNIRSKGLVIENYYPAAVSIELFDKVQAIKHRKVKVKAAGRKSINIFTGKVFCVKCGQKVYFETDDKVVKGKKYLYYTLKCSARRYGGCDNKTIRYLDFLNANLEIPTFLGSYSENPYDNEKLKKELSSTNEAIKVEKNKLSEIEKLFEKGEFDTELFLKHGTRLKNSIKKMELNIKDISYKLSLYDKKDTLIDFDYENEEDIAKAKNIIDQKFSAFIVNGDAKQAVQLHKSGNYNLISWSEKRWDYEEIKKNLVTYSSNLMLEWEQGRLDGKFSEILDSLFTWGADGDHRLNFKDFDIHNHDIFTKEIDFSDLITEHWDSDLLARHLSRINTKQSKYLTESEEDFKKRIEAINKMKKNTKIT